MNKFGFLIHPLTINHFCRTFGKAGNLYEKISPFILKNFLKIIPPYIFAHLEKISSPTGNVAEGYVVMCPLLPDQFVAYKKDLAKKKILNAVMLAQNLGVQLIGLGGFTSIVTNGGLELVKDVNINITTGNTYTSVLAVEGLLKAAESMRINLKKATICVIGATGDIGSICSKFLTNFISKIILVGKDEARLSIIKESIEKENKSVVIETSINIKNAILNSNLILAATSAFIPIIDVQDLRPGSVLCDISYPMNINMDLASKRKDVLIFEGGLARIDYFELSAPKIKTKINLFNSQNCIHGCFAETMLLALENRIESFSLGKCEISMNKIFDIKRIASRHGFELAPFVFNGRILNQKDIESIYRNSTR